MPPPLLQPTLLSVIARGSLINRDGAQKCERKNNGNDDQQQTTKTIVRLTTTEADDGTIAFRDRAVFADGFDSRSGRETVHSLLGQARNCSRRPNGTLKPEPVTVSMGTRHTHTISANSNSLSGTSRQQR